MKNYFDKEFELRYFEMNELGVATPTTMLTLLEEAAADHCYSISHSLYQLEEEGIGWVLFSGVMQMKRYPKYKEKIIIRTWLSKYSTIKGIRENIIYGENGDVIGSAKGLWVFFDINKRKPTQIYDSIKEKWSFCATKSIDYNISKKIELVENPDVKLRFVVNKYDTDMNKHVNNIRYLQWAIESVPDEIVDKYYLDTIDGRFLAEAHFGQTVVVLTKFDKQDNSFIHTIKIEGTDIVCATAKTVWKINRKTAN